ncbi:MAG: endonuclease V [Phycisphaerae bacterium]
MKVARLHPWDLSTAEAAAVQTRLAAEVRQGPALGRVDVVAGADVSGGRRGETIAAAVVVMRMGTFEVLEVSRTAMRATWPYVPGFLSFREAPVVLEAFRCLKVRPDLVICDGQGRAHPRRLGLASHVGLALAVPTVGCAKSRLIGEVRREPPRRRGGRAPLVDGRERIGTILRTRTGVKPVFVSVGHAIDLASAERWVLAASPRFRLAEPIREAHRLVSASGRIDGGGENRYI